MTVGTAENYLRLAEEAAGAPPETFGALGTRIGKSRPYVSKLKANGTIHSDAIVVQGSKVLLNPAIALRQLAAAATTLPADDTPRPDADPHAPAFATARTRKLQADAAAAELDLDIKRGRYIDRTTAGPAIAGFFRTIRDGVILAIREHPDRPEAAVNDFFAHKAKALPNVLSADGAEPAPPG